MKGSPRPWSQEAKGGFTLVELLVVIAIVGILASLLLPSLSRAKAKGTQAVCLNNIRQLHLAWTMYHQDHEDRLAYNLGGGEIKDMLARGEHYNWANSVLNWEVDPANTNTLLNTEASLGSYLSHNSRVFRCPSDDIVSAVQKEAGYIERSRSISMNAMVGDAGEFTESGSNVNNPYYHQYLKASEFESSSEIFVFIEEHPDSVNDGYFLNRARSHEWNDLPASYHNGSANLSFADGHAESHRWLEPSTLKPAEPDSADLPFALSSGETADYYWVLERTSISSRRYSKAY